MKKYEWEIPAYNIDRIKKRKARYCLCIPVINEGERIYRQLEMIKGKGINKNIDIIICDGGSSDGSTELKKLKELDVCCLLTKTGPGRLSAQLRMGYSFTLIEGYEGVITIDGNCKDSVENINDFIKALDQGWDFIQGSRYMKGGKAVNTPFIRHLAVKLIHIPVISLLSGFKYSDTTNGYRAYSKKILSDERISPFRNIFQTYELLAYLSVRIPRLGYKVKEIPVTRKYPEEGRTPTKISFLKGNFILLKILLNLFLKRYDP